MSRTVLFQSRALALNAGNRNFSTETLDVDSQTKNVIVSILRPSTANPLVIWDSNGTMNVQIELNIDGTPFTCTGRATGGIRTNLSGLEIDSYQLIYNLPRGFFGNTDRQRRLGELSTQFFRCRVLCDLVRGSISTSIIIESDIEPPPTGSFHSSVVFDAATDANEISGDGVLSLTHTATGSDRAAFAAEGNSSGTQGQASTSITYAGNSMTEMWDTTPGASNFCRQAGYSLAGAGVTTGAQTVTNILAGGVDEHILAVITMTGVDSATPVGTPQTTQGLTTTTYSVVVGSVGANDLVVDFTYLAGPGTNSDANCNPGANQTERTAEPIASNVNFGGSSTQLGSAGGDMAWTVNNTGYGYTLGAVNFKELVAGGSSIVPIIDKQYRHRWS